MPPDSGSTRESRRSLSCTNSSSSADRSRISARGQVEVAAVDHEVVPHRELGVEVVLLGNDAEPGPDPRRRRARDRARARATRRRNAARRSRSSASSTSCPRRSDRGSRTPRPVRSRSRCRRPRRTNRTASSRRALRPSDLTRRRRYLSAFSQPLEFRAQPSLARDLRGPTYSCSKPVRFSSL